jgi:apoptosis-inducing factor 2
VTIVQGLDGLLHDTYPVRFRKYVAEGLTARGVEIVYDDFIDAFAPESDFRPPSGSVTTRRGRTIAADLVVPTRGGQPNTAFLRRSGLPLNDAGQICVEQTFEVKGASSVFAIGDATDVKEQKQATKHDAHMAVLVPNVLAALGGRRPEKRYGGAPEMILITNGKVVCISQICTFTCV